MPAFLHVASYTGPGAARMLSRVRWLHDGLEGVPGLVAGRVFATLGFWSPTGGYPTFRRWALLCAFEDDEALVAFQGSRMARAFADGAREAGG